MRADWRKSFRFFIFYPPALDRRSRKREELLDAELLKIAIKNSKFFFPQNSKPTALK